MREPLEGCSKMEKVRSSPSMSLPRSAMSSGVSSRVTKDCGVAEGASLTGVTAISTVAGREVLSVSLTLKVKETVSFEFSVGEKTRLGAVPERMPEAG